MNTRRILLVLLICVAANANGASLIHRAPQKAAARQNPFQGEEIAVRAGAKLYARECASCHGNNRGGIGKAPPLATRTLHEAMPGSLFWVLTHGALGRGMPSFAHLPEAQRWQIVTFLLGSKQARDNCTMDETPH